MTGFTVNPAALEAFGRLLSDVSPDAGLERKYLIDNGNYADTWVHMGSGDGGVIFREMVGKTSDAHDQLVTQNYLIRTVLSESSDGLLTSAGKYRAQDRASAQQLDSQYQPGGVAPLDFTPEVKAVDDPAEVLREEPSEEGGVPDWAQQIMDGAGFFSVSDVVLKIIKVCGFDAMGWVRDKFLGDFHVAARVMHALRALEKFDEIVARDVAEGTTSMLGEWTGNAADAAHSYFDQLANTINARAEALFQVAGNYENMLAAIQEAAAAIEGLLTGLLDKAVLAAAKLAAAGCLQEVPVVDVLMDIIGAEAVVEVMEKIDQTIGKWNALWSGSEGLVSLALGLTGALSDFDITAKLPTAGYYNASQGPAPTYDDGHDIPHGGRGPR
jgi:uncharacterized protein YukE